MRFIVIGRIGSDAGYWEIVNGKLIHVPGWNPEALEQFGAAVNIISQATQLKAPGLAEAAINSVIGFAQQQLEGHVKGAGTTIIVVG